MYYTYQKPLLQCKNGKFSIFQFYKLKLRRRKNQENQEIKHIMLFKLSLSLCYWVAVIYIAVQYCALFSIVRCGTSNRIEKKKTKQRKQKN